MNNEISPSNFAYSDIAEILNQYNAVDNDGKRTINYILDKLNEK